MTQVSKLLIVDNDGKHLLMYRSDHPDLPNDPDLPGGMVEAGESPLDAALREAMEEAGVTIDEQQVEALYSGTDYSAHHTHYSLYRAVLPQRPTLTMSWEHSSYEWLDYEAFLQKARGAVDTYMHMVHDVLK